MNQINAGLMALEMHEREAFHRNRARREQFGVVGDSGPRRRVWRRTTRRAA